MAPCRRTITGLLILMMAGIVCVGIVYTLPDTMTRLSYAVEAGKSLAAKEKLSSVDDLSAAFRKAMADQDLGKGVRLQLIRDNVRRFVFVKINK